MERIQSVQRSRRPLIKAIKGMLAVTFVGGCRLAPVYQDAGTKDASDDVSASDATTDSATDASFDAHDSSPDAENDASDAAEATDAADSGG
jgi:hypothetical protein